MTGHEEPLRIRLLRHKFEQTLDKFDKIGEDCGDLVTIDIDDDEDYNALFDLNDEIKRYLLFELHNGIPMSPLISLRIQEHQHIFDKYPEIHRQFNQFVNERK